MIGFTRKQHILASLNSAFVRSETIRDPNLFVLAHTLKWGDRASGRRFEVANYGYSEYCIFAIFERIPEIHQPTIGYCRGLLQLKDYLDCPDVLGRIVTDAQVDSANLRFKPLLQPQTCSMIRYVESLEKVAAVIDAHLSANRYFHTCWNSRELAELRSPSGSKLELEDLRQADMTTRFWRREAATADSASLRFYAETQLEIARASLYQHQRDLAQAGFPHLLIQTAANIPEQHSA